MVKAQHDINDERKATVYGGLKSGSIGLGAGVLGSIALQRSGVQAYRKLTLPLKAFALTSVTTAAFIIGADAASRKYELQKYQIGSGTALEREAREGIRLEEQAGISGRGSDRGSQRGPATSTSDMLMEFGRQHRYGVVFSAWAASMVGSFGYISFTPLSFAQKLVQARMVAQGLTVAVLIASAGLSLTEDRQKRVEREDTMYAWKEGSPHAAAAHQHTPTSTSVEEERK